MKPIQEIWSSRATDPRWVVALAVVLFGWNLWGYDLWAPDEPFFGEGAREMVADGEWLVPHINGEVNTHKPPLFFWLIALFSLPFGEVSVAHRPPAVGARRPRLAAPDRPPGAADGRCAGSRCSPGRSWSPPISFSTRRARRRSTRSCAS